MPTPRVLFANNGSRQLTPWCRVLLLVILALIVACSKEASRDEEGNEGSQERSQEVSAERASGKDVDEGGGDKLADISSETDDASDPAEIIRRLDRVIDGADAHILSRGIDAGAASSTQPLDMLGPRLRSAQAQLEQMRALE